ncbi:hypothetical protein ILUMI_11633 [Ignelater luminosus]|uniref:Uncharacterized protein n=1 Tax=Ignelater luminosus TaxID=2038154 RepID=A0A8K0GCJ0_IGNLU|nr:hypothetical protein ILUMI_11633 [Ignelater luminosus]
MSDSTLDFIPTRSSRLNKTSQEKFQAVVYNSHKKANAPENNTVHSNVKKVAKVASNNTSFNIKQAKHEVVRFGMSGLDPQEKEEAKVQLAIRLGAKPPKNKCKNYKQLLEERKKEKEATKARLEFQQLGKNQMGKSTAKGKGFDRKRRKQKSDLLDDYGKVKARSNLNRS